MSPYLDSDDIADGPHQAPSRWIIDFNLSLLEAANKYPLALSILREKVKPERDTNNDAGFRTKWWLFGRPRVEMRNALQELKSYIAVGRHGKRMFVVRVEKTDIASDATVVFAFDDDYSMGILMSRAHDAWAWAQSSTLETRLRYTSTSVFETFAWPDPVKALQHKNVAVAAIALYERRSEFCLDNNIGLTKLYNLMDDGAFTDLADLHKKLDVAVVTAYGWPTSIAQNGPELVHRLSELNREIVKGGRPYNPFGHPDA